MPPSPVTVRVLAFAPPKLIQLTPADLFLLGLDRMEGIEEVGGDNHGRAVKRILARVGLAVGNPWCAALMYDAGNGMLGDRWPLPRTGSCDVLLERARQLGILVETPMVGDVALLMRKDYDAIHTYAVTGVGKGLEHRSIEGNTNDDGSANGYCVLRRTRGGPTDRAIARGLYYRFIRWHAPAGVHP